MNTLGSTPETRADHPGRDEATIDDQAIVNRPELWLEHLPAPRQTAHKYSRGYAFLLGGEFMTGAACLAARAAQRIGAGLVSIACPNNAGDVYRIVNQSALTRGFRDTAEFKEWLSDPRINALLVGPGLGDGVANAERVTSMLRSSRPIVLDADALNLMAHNREQFIELFHQRDTSETVLLTPHRGEFGRLFPEFAGLDPAEATARAAQLCRAVIVYKQHQSYIATPELLWRQDDAPAWLATGGSGDVLSGLCLGLMAQGLAASTSALIAHHVHAQAAHRFGAGLVAEDLTCLIPSVYAELLKQRQACISGSDDKA